MNRNSSGSICRRLRIPPASVASRVAIWCSVLIELNLIDTQGGGIKRMFETQRRRSFPLPDYDLTETSRVAVTIHGRILDEHYTRLLMEGLDLDLDLVMLLDRVQKGLRIDREGHRRLKSSGLVEGRYPNLTVAGSVARATGNAGRHIRERGFDNQYYLDMKQKRAKISNLLQYLRMSGKVVNQGTRSRPAWVARGPASGKGPS